MYNKKLYKNKFHSEDLSELNFLVTGGAGFIGSNIVEYLLKNNAKLVRVIDNLSNGYLENIKDFLDLDNFEFIQGDIRDLKTCERGVKDIDYVSHQAALGSVPRSIEDPVLTNSVNISGFLNILMAVKDSKRIKRFVYAASSSTYGDSKDLPKKEGIEGDPLSPYAVTKLVNEIYADVFSKVYNFNSIGLRYFNVFGPKQNPDNPYAAVIPIFCKKFSERKKPTINGSGKISRDFTFVENVVQANVKAFFKKELNKHQVFNIACGKRVSLDDIINLLNKFSGNSITPIYGNNRAGDIEHSHANIALAIKELGYSPLINFEEGLSILFSE
jgi:UDP-N-acetylglucosamine/UDP-N-acetylgalactosamine 4-epimerase